MGSYGLNGGVPLSYGANGCACYIAKRVFKDNLHFLLDCSVPSRQSAACILETNMHYDS